MSDGVGGEGVEARLRGRLGAFSLDLAFSLPPTGVTALVGPSGSGKSTVLRALAGLVRLEGEVRVGWAVWQEGRRFLPPHRRPVGYVFQHAALLPHLSVQGNLAYAAKRAGVPPADLERTAERLGLTPLLQRAPGGLSGGERQRVALARALLTRPRLLLLDEPLSGLDAAGKAELLPTLEAALADLACPALYVSHDAGEVARLSQRQLHLSAGRLVGPYPTPADTVQALSDAEVRGLARAALAAGLAPL